MQKLGLLLTVVLLCFGTAISQDKEKGKKQVEYEPSLVGAKSHPDVQLVFEESFGRVLNSSPESSIQELSRILNCATCTEEWPGVKKTEFKQCPDKKWIILITPNDSVQTPGEYGAFLNIWLDRMQPYLPKNVQRLVSKDRKNTWLIETPKNPRPCPKPETPATTSKSGAISGMIARGFHVASRSSPSAPSFYKKAVKKGTKEHEIVLPLGPFSIELL
jgi:hypothetical protein